MLPSGTLHDKQAMLVLSMSWSVVSCSALWNQPFPGSTGGDVFCCGRSHAGAHFDKLGKNVLTSVWEAHPYLALPTCAKNGFVENYVFRPTGYNFCVPAVFSVCTLWYQSKLQNGVICRRTGVICHRTGVLGRRNGVDFWSRAGLPPSFFSLKVRLFSPTGENYCFFSGSGCIFFLHGRKVQVLIIRCVLNYDMGMCQNRGHQQLCLSFEVPLNHPKNH